MPASLMVAKVKTLQTICQENTELKPVHWWGGVGFFFFLFLLFWEGNMVRCGGGKSW